MQALAQTGLAFSTGNYDTQRYQRFMEMAAEMVEKHSQLAREEILQTFIIQPGYATVKVDVRGAIIRDGKILLVQERSDEKWCLPGGWADVGEVPSEMVEREVREESGFIVKAKKIIAVFDANRSGRPLEFFHAYKIVFLCDITGGYPRASEETLDVGFFEFDRLPVLSENRTSQLHLSEVQAHIKDALRPVYFD
jgi:ADP-ribose pyrophosphatase YjhB (NUDIX family)